MQKAYCNYPKKEIEMYERDPDFSERPKPRFIPYTKNGITLWADTTREYTVQYSDSFGQEFEIQYHPDNYQDRQ
ncbi:MAG TPA: hypothetical protein PKD20_01950 [Candidatus Saccharibacteria bacterium]|nr:hypothetical protein [Candidatus Saccharibacteria bacterium]HMT55622.1 hypothetical protein [Candidatus Saccharibacteria bacterium]